MAYAGYGSAGGQPERHVLPEGLQAPDRAEAILRHGLFLGVKSLLAQSGKLRGFGGRAPKEAGQTHLNCTDEGGEEIAIPAGQQALAADGHLGVRLVGFDYVQGKPAQGG